MIVTAAEMARAVGIDPKRFRSALRAANFPWHGRDQPWSVEQGSSEHRQLAEVLDGLRAGLRRSAVSGARPARLGSRDGSDEHYIIDLCDEVLGQRAHRGHKFDFLRGDADRNGIARSLPVDAYYPALSLVIEYCERQHSESVPFFDRRETVSGVGRGEQRAIYDQRRKDILPRNGIALMVLSYGEFGHDGAKRLLRRSEDRSIIEQRLAIVLADRS
ncbi:hypothetical protein LZ518_11605 [Sphingomonas sp. RB56-2]|uniref:Uncharacterized protein n=1 Tax=Sphingomonas brevis TaxID=2908206 RepID=A0ABT0SCA3_9SPHN|nr:hypothetical protein [Sphingomonas brevis]MCL6741772.1 hypothetical protein [Sphingomonas brevis]